MKRKVYKCAKAPECFSENAELKKGKGHRALPPRALLNVSPEREYI